MSKLCKCDAFEQQPIHGPVLNEIFRRVQCSPLPKLRVDAASVAFDHSFLPFIYPLNPYSSICRENHVKSDNVEYGTYDIPCPDGAIEMSVSANLSVIHPTCYSRISLGAVVVFVIELLMLVLFDAQLMVANAVSPGFTYFWIAQLVVASISIFFFACSICARRLRSKVEAVMANFCLMTNIFIIICAAMVVAQYSFTAFQTYSIRMAFLAGRSFNCAVCITIFRKELLKYMGMFRKKDGVHCKAEIPQNKYQPQIPTLQLPNDADRSYSSLPQNNLPKKSSVLIHVTNRLALLRNNCILQEYFTCSQELKSVCQSQNRLLVSVGDVQKTTTPEVFEMLSELSLGGHVVVDCDADGRSGLMEIFGVCSLVCKWLQSNTSNTVVIFHQDSQSCVSILTCCIIIASGLAPRCEHALMLVMLSFTLQEFHDLGLTRAGSRRMLRHFECFFHAEQHPVRAVPRFLSMIVLKGCVPLPPGFVFSVDVICCGTTRVKSGKLLFSSAVDENAHELECQHSSASTCTFVFEAGCVLCRGDVEVNILVKNMGNGISAKVASVLTHTSFCGFLGPPIFRCSAADIDWLKGKEHAPILFADIELHFRNCEENGSYDPMALAFAGKQLLANQYPLDTKLFVQKLLKKTSQKHLASGVSLNSDHPSTRSSNIVIIMNGACSVELSHSNALKPATFSLQALASGQMLPSLKVTTSFECLFILLTAAQMFLGHEDLPFGYVTVVPTTALEFKLSAWPPCSDLGLGADDNLLLLRYCAREYWDYLQSFRRKAGILSSAPFQQQPSTSAGLNRIPRSCRIGMAILLEIAQQPEQSIRLLVAAVHVHVSLIAYTTFVLSLDMLCHCNLLFLPLQSSAPHVQAHGLCALFPAFLLFVGRFAGSIMWTKVPFSRDLVSWRQDHVVLLQNTITTNWFVAACDNSEAVTLLAEINLCLNDASASHSALSSTFDAFSNRPQSHGLPAEPAQLGKSVDSIHLPRAATFARFSRQGDTSGAVLPETLLFGEHRYFYMKLTTKFVIQLVLFMF